MSETEKERDVHERQVWHVEFRVDKDLAWNMVGLERDDPAVVLRLFEYWAENNSDVELRLRQTDVSVATLDVEELRKLVAEREPVPSE